MLIPIAAADGILLDLRYASVADVLGRATFSRGAALLRRPAPACRRRRIRNRALLLGPMAACGWEHHVPEWRHDHLPGRETCPALAAADVPGGPI